MSLPRIAIVIGSTREARFGDKPAAWIAGIAGQRSDATVEIVDLRDYPLPLFDEARSPVYEQSSNPVARQLAERMQGFDGYIFVTAEYNHSFTGALKNALDHLYGQFTRKPAAFLGYGGVGGARAVEQLRLVAIELQMAALRNAVHIGLFELRSLIRGEATFEQYPYLADAAKMMLDDLVWWTVTLRAGRDAG